jgi:hypothetical protein
MSKRQVLRRADWLEAMKRAFILVTIFVFIFVSPGLSFELSPSNIKPGEEMVLTGIAKPGSQLSFQSSFTMNLPVTAGKYEYEATVEIPQKPNRFTVAARNVEDFNAGVKFGIWITKSFKASGGTARISQGDVPPGRYNLKIFGTALPGSTEIPVTVEAETQVQADSAGKYNLAIDTSGIPAGEYRIAGAGETKVVRLGDGSSSPVSTSSELAGESIGTGSKESNSGKANGEKSSIETTAKPVTAKPVTTKPVTTKPVTINQETVGWYARQIGLEYENSSQYNTAKKLLEERLQGGYWKIIARGEPLTEVAGNCQQEYCLVRGVDACTACRDRDMVLRGSTSLNDSSANATVLPDIPSKQSPPPAEEPAQQRSFVSTFLDWIRQMLGL